MPLSLCPPHVRTVSAEKKARAKEEHQGVGIYIVVQVDTIPVGVKNKKVGVATERGGRESVP